MDVEHRSYNLNTAGCNRSIGDELFADYLTALGNRRLLDKLDSEWQSRRDGAQDSMIAPALILIDLDRFKHVNDTLGHPVGDQVLQLVAARIENVLREEDVAIRLGGDEFVVVLGARPASSACIRRKVHANDAIAAAECVAERLIGLLTKPYLIDSQQINIGASAGIAGFSDEATSVDVMLRHADLALYAAKQNGKGRHQVFDPSLEARAQARRQLEIDLRRAIRLEEFAVVYQPQIALENKALTGFEALLRWVSPERGPISPDQFIPLAEEIGEIHAIGRWVLREACHEALLWPESLRVSVNVSPIQLDDGGFVETVLDTLAEVGLPPTRLEIELTEGALMKNTTAVRRQLEALHDHGIDIAMDDFGTGYSSLSYLHEFPFSRIKIDQSFVRRERDATTEALVGAIIGIGKSLGIQTLAEGVETEEQLQALQLQGCTSAQGYLISHPLAADAVDAFISKLRRAA